MPANLNALIRYKTIDRCLSNRYRQWSIHDLIEKCSEAPEEYRGISKVISERTVRDDIRIMRSDILGFNGPMEDRIEPLAKKIPFAQPLKRRKRYIFPVKAAGKKAREMMPERFHWGQVHHLFPQG